MRRHTKEEIKEAEIIKDQTDPTELETIKELEEEPTYPPRRPNLNAAIAFVLIVFGTLFLLNNFGILPWNIWHDLWRFWPLFLIFWGLKTIFGKSKTANILLLIISLIVVGYFLLSTIAHTNPQLDSYLKQNFPILNNIPVPPSPPTPPDKPNKPKRPRLFEREEIDDDDEDINDFDIDDDSFEFP